MKQSPEEKRQLARLAASRISAQGFMGSDTRSLEQIIAEDRDILRRLSCPIDELARKLPAIDERIRAAMGAPVALTDEITGRHFEAMGRIPSPFPGEGVFPKGETLIEWNDGRRLRITRLGLWLIERHGFFQGHGSPYRIEPALAVELIRTLQH